MHSSSPQIKYIEHQDLRHWISYLFQLQPIFCRIQTISYISCKIHLTSWIKSISLRITKERAYSNLQN